MHRLSTANTAAAAAPVALIVVAPNAAVATATAPEAASVTVAPNAAVKYLTVPLVDLITINDFFKIRIASFPEEMSAKEYRNFCLQVVELIM